MRCGGPQIKGLLLRFVRLTTLPAACGGGAGIAGIVRRWEGLPPLFSTLSENALPVGI